ncbi:MAG TPA: ABC transporter substrate-binding protein [Acidimicrobiales bacterium]
MKHPRPFRLLAALVALLLGALALGACGDDDDDVSSSGGDNPPTTGEAAPQRIVSISSTATEVLFAIGAGDAVVAVDDYSTYPPEAPRTDLSAFTPNVEAIAGYEPDLVVLSNDTDDVVSRLHDLGIETFVMPAAQTLDEAYAQWEELGARTGHAEEAAELVETTKRRIQAAIDRAPKFERPLRYYHELESTLYTVTSQTFIGAIYSLVGLESIADKAADASGGYPQLSAEFIVDEDPDLVFLANTKCCGETAETFAQRPGFDVLSAVRNGTVIELDDDIASRWGPRIADLVETVVDALDRVPATVKAA